MDRSSLISDFIQFIKSLNHLPNLASRPLPLSPSVFTYSMNSSAIFSSKARSLASASFIGNSSLRAAISSAVGSPNCLAASEYNCSLCAWLSIVLNTIWYPSWYSVPDSAADHRYILAFCTYPCTNLSPIFLA